MTKEQRPSINVKSSLADAQRQYAKHSKADAPLQANADLHVIAEQQVWHID